MWLQMATSFQPADVQASLALLGVQLAFRHPPPAAASVRAPHLRAAPPGLALEAAAAGTQATSVIERGSDFRVPNSAVSIVTRCLIRVQVAPAHDLL